jgi:hypothetical protein
VLSAIYEEDFLGFSYGFRLRRGEHDGLHALTVGIKSRSVKWIAEGSASLSGRALLCVTSNLRQEP